MFSTHSWHLGTKNVKINSQCFEMLMVKLGKVRLIIML